LEKETRKSFFSKGEDFSAPKEKIFLLRRSRKIFCIAEEISPAKKPQEI
jgi:hypothetical protein